MNFDRFCSDFFFRVEHTVKNQLDNGEDDGEDDDDENIKINLYFDWLYSVCNDNPDKCDKYGIFRFF